MSSCLGSVFSVYVEANLAAARSFAYSSPSCQSLHHSMSSVSLDKDITFNRAAATSITSSLAQKQTYCDAILVQRPSLVPLIRRPQHSTSRLWHLFRSNKRYFHLSRNSGIHNCDLSRHYVTVTWAAILQLSLLSTLHANSRCCYNHSKPLLN